MMAKHWFVGLVAGILAVGAPAQAAPPEAGGLATRLLAAHNHERARLGIPLLAWNDQLMAEAAVWARSLARRQAFEHARNLRGAGENLWTGTKGRYSPEEMIGGFLDEARFFRPGRFPRVSSTGNWADVGHYTQLIWRGTREVGCALVSGKQDDVLVCRYRPGGNVIGQQVP